MMPVLLKQWIQKETMEFARLKNYVLHSKTIMTSSFNFKYQRTIDSCNNSKLNPAD